MPNLLADGRTEYLPDKMDKVSFATIIVSQDGMKIYLRTYWS